MKINNQIVKGCSFAYDGCHKIYICETTEDEKHAERSNYRILAIEVLPETFENSCSLRFISNWKLDKHYVKQFEEAIFN